jgi:hypothetical protein
MDIIVDLNQEPVMITWKSGTDMNLDEPLHSISRTVLFIKAKILVKR